MFERFTDEAREVIVAAQGESRRLRSGDIGTEHLLAALPLVPRSVAAEVLDALGVAPHAVRARVEAHLADDRREPPTSAHIPFTPAAKRSLELALREALELGDHEIGTEHLLLSLIRNPGGDASKILAELGVDADRVVRQALEVRKRTAEPIEHVSPGRRHRRDPRAPRRPGESRGELLVAAGPDDVPWATGRLWDHLSRRYDLIDVAEWAADAEASASRPFALLVIVGPSFLPLPADPDDAVRRGLAAALSHEVPTVVTLVDGAAMPTEAELPDDLGALASAEHVALRPDGFTEQVLALVPRLNELLIAHERPDEP